MVVRDYKNEAGKHVVDIKCRSCDELVYQGVDFQAEENHHIDPRDDVCSQCKKTAEEANELYEWLWWAGQAPIRKSFWSYEWIRRR